MWWKIEKKNETIILKNVLPMRQARKNRNKRPGDVKK